MRGVLPLTVGVALSSMEDSPAFVPPFMLLFLYQAILYLSNSYNYCIVWDWHYSRFDNHGFQKDSASSCFKGRLLSMQHVLKCMEIDNNRQLLNHRIILLSSRDLLQDCSWFTRKFLLHPFYVFSLVIHQEIYVGVYMRMIPNFVTSHTTGQYYCFSISDGLLHLNIY